MNRQYTRGPSLSFSFPTWLHVCSHLPCLHVTCHLFGVISSGAHASPPFKVMLIHDMSVWCYSKRHDMGQSDFSSPPITNDAWSSDCFLSQTGLCRRSLRSLSAPPDGRPQMKPLLYLLHFLASLHLTWRCLLPWPPLAMPLSSAQAPFWPRLWAGWQTWLCPRET